MKIFGASPKAGISSDAYVPELECQAGFYIGHEGNGPNSTKISNNITIENTEVYDIYGDFVDIFTANNVLIRNNRFERSGRQGIAVVGGDNIDIKNNIISDTGRQTIDLEPAPWTNVTIEDNTFGAGHLWWIVATGWEPATVKGITVRNNSLSRCMSIYAEGFTTVDRGNWLVENNISSSTGFRVYPLLPRNTIGQYDTQMLYRVYSRGASGRSIFADSWDKWKFLSLLSPCGQAMSLLANLTG